MPDRITAFLGSFRNAGLDESGEEQTRALADYTTNSLHVCESVDNPVEMTLIHAFVSREEFMHGEWSVSLIHSCARLRLAFIDALYEMLDDPDCIPDRFPTAYRAWMAADSLDDAIDPFQEAVDKLQILSVILGDTEFFESIQETFEAVYGTDYTDEEIRERLNDEIDEQYDIARGAITLPSDNRGTPYVNPLYYYALIDAADVREPADEQPSNDSLNEIDRLSDQRSIAETVAQVTLDIPNSIEPLGPDTESDPLRVEGLDVKPLSADAIADRYAVSDDAIEQYLLDPHVSKIENESLRTRIGTTVEEYDPNWLDAVFVTVLQALDDLKEDDETSVIDLDPDELRRKLAREVHDVDIESATTMLDRPTSLLRIPAEASANAPEQDLLSAESEPLPKILIEAFEQHGSFGAVVFQPNDDEHKRQLNYHTFDIDSIDENSDVPDGIDTYQGLWEHYFVGKHLANELFVRRHQYSDALKAAFGDAYENVESLQQALESVADEIHPPEIDTETTADVEAQPARARAQKSTLAEDSSNEIDQTSLEQAFSERLESEGFSSSVDDSLADEMRDYLDRWLPRNLHMAAKLLDDVDSPKLSDHFDPVECPLCTVISDPCGGDECVTASLREQFDELHPQLLEALMDIEANYAGQDST